MNVNKDVIEIFLDDFKEDVKKEIINIIGDDNNYDIFPIAQIIIPENN